MCESNQKKRHLYIIDSYLSRFTVIFCSFNLFTQQSFSHLTKLKRTKQKKNEEMKGDSSSDQY